MKKILVAASITLLLTSGCSLLDPIKKGTKTTTYYDTSGKPVQTIQQDEAIGDKTTEYNKSVRTIAEENTKKVIQIATEIKTLAQPLPDDSKEVSAYKQAMGLMALDRLAGGDIERPIKAIHYGKDKYDVSETAIKEGATVGQVGAVTYGAVKLADKVGDSAGDTTTTSADGAGASTSVSTKKTSVNTDSKVSTSGDSSPAEAPNNQTATSDPVSNTTNEAAPVTPVVPETAETTEPVAE